MPYADLYRPDRLFLPQQLLLNRARNIPTPFYLYDEDGIRKSARTLLGSFCWNPGHRAYFPITANCSPAVLRILHELGIGLLARSIPELKLAVTLGLSGQELLFHTPAMTQAAADLVMQSGAGVIFDAPEQIDCFHAGLPARCLLRFHPGKTRTASLFTSATDKHKAGMNREQIFAAAEKLRALGVQELGLHCHLAGSSLSEAYYPAAAAALFRLAEELADRKNIRVSVCDIGGGLGLPAHTEGEQLNLPHIGTLVRDRYREIFSDSFAPAVYTELGRFVLAPHGLLVSRVVEVRERDRHYAVLDASVGNIPGLIVHRAAPHISVVGSCSRKDRKVYSVHGCSADSRDRFCDRTMLPLLHPGDLVAIHSAGAYAQAAQWLSSLLPPAGGYVYTLDGAIVRAD